MRLAGLVRRIIRWPVEQWFRWRWRRWAASKPRVVHPLLFAGREVGVRIGPALVDAVIVGRTGDRYRVRDIAGQEILVRAEEIQT